MESSHPHNARIVILHGRAAAMEIPELFEREWVASARYGLQRIGYDHAACVPVSMPFYGQFWRPDAFTEEPKFDDGTGRGPERGLLPHFDFGRAIEAFGEWIDGRTGASGKVLNHLLDDTREYYERSDLRSLTDALVEEACQGPGEVVLVGFSMGSLVAYNVLAHAVGGFPVKSLVTCGSPLGDPAFKQRAASVVQGGSLQFPTCLRMWANIWNDDDPATRVHELTSFFEGNHEIQSAPTRGRGPSPINPAAAHNGSDYLSSKALAAAVATGLRAADQIASAPREGGSL